MCYVFIFFIHLKQFKKSLRLDTLQSFILLSFVYNIFQNIKIIIENNTMASGHYNKFNDFYQKTKDKFNDMGPALTGLKPTINTVQSRGTQCNL